MTVQACCVELCAFIYQAWQDWWEAGMSLNSGSFLICTIQARWSSSVIKVLFPHWVASVHRASGGCGRGEAVPTEMHCSGGIVCDLAQQIWWIVAIVRMFWSIWKTFWTKQWSAMDSTVMHITHCSLPLHVHEIPTPSMFFLKCDGWSALHIHIPLRNVWKENLCVWVRLSFCMPHQICYSFSFSGHRSKFQACGGWLWEYTRIWIVKSWIKSWFQWVWVSRAKEHN